MKLKALVLFLFISLKLYAGNGLHGLTSTEGDPDGFIADSVNVINGDYCEVVRDLNIIGPDQLILDRYFNSQNYITGMGVGSWRILPHRFLVIGQDPTGKSCKVGKDEFKWSLAFTGERSGGILTYNGWIKIDGSTKDPLKIDHL